MYLQKNTHKSEKKWGEERIWDEYVELEEDPLLGVGAGGPVSAEVRVEDVGRFLRRRLAGHGLDLVGQGFRPRLSLQVHRPDTTSEEPRLDSRVRAR